MSNLREIVAARRGVEAGAPASLSPPVPEPRTLQVEIGGCERWLMAWSQFVCAHYHEKAKQEELVLRFAEHEIVIQGHRLARLLAEVGAYRLDCVREQAHSGMAAHGGSDPVVSRIQIRTLNGSGRSEEPAEPS